MRGCGTCVGTDVTHSCNIASFWPRRLGGKAQRNTYNMQVHTSSAIADNTDRTFISQGLPSANMRRETTLASAY